MKLTRLFPVKTTLGWAVLPGDGYMYGPTPSFWLLLRQIVREWRHEKHIVG